MKSRLIWLAAAAVIVLVAAIVWLALRGPRVDVLELRYAPLVRTLQFSARVATLSRVDIGSTLTGRVAQVLVREGAQVRAGEVLIRLESDELRAALAQAVAGERQANARLAGLRTTGRAAANAGLAQADSTLRAAQSELTRSEQLMAQGFVSGSRLDEVRRVLEVARAQQASAKAQTQANEDSGTDTRQAQAQMALAHAATVAAQARLAQASLVAPAAARVLSRQVEPGQIVQPGRALLSVALAGPTQINAQVDERFLDQLLPGQLAAVVADAFAGQGFAARVQSIAPAVDAQRGVIEIKFSLEQQAPAFLREDMTLSVEVETARRDRALVLPLVALHTQASGSSATVLVVVNGRLQERSLRLGLRTLDAVEVLEGLADGDAVVLKGDFRAGERVRAQVLEWQPGKAGAQITGRKDVGDVGSALTNAMGR